ncbi:MAG: YicC family protein [Acidobacteriota bacterium]|nr:YicC family protein [Acidobacteriota bacterium]MDW3229630.1 YicC family protein [Acidobacteriota bacterium]MDY0231197.1 YicC/YloC family endoribonuclease [Candidatus Saccharicenans sp.]
MRSMTGFAEKTFNSPDLRVKIFIKTLNHRFFDWVYKGSGIGQLENQLRAACQKKVLRGRVEIYLQLDFLSPESWIFSVNQPLLAKIVSEMKSLSKKVELPFSLTLEQFFQVPQLVSVSQKELSRKEKSFILSAFEKTLEEITCQREKEGREIARQLSRHLSSIKKSLAEIERIFQKQPEELKTKLERKLRDLNHNNLSKERLSEEVAYLMQRFDLAEEINRLKIHLMGFSELIKPEAGESVGKKLDFLAQEMSREANTLNSKAQDLSIIRHCLKIKNEIESIRQQVQNLE